jgi:hypothetical protein
MKVCTAHIKGVTPLSLSRMHDTPKLDGERPDEWEARTWREKAHYDENGVAYMPGIAFKQAMDSAAKYLSLQIPGKGKATFSKHFLSGVICINNLSLGKTREDFQSITINANANGQRGSGKRVKRTFPITLSWEGELQFYVLDDAIPKSVFEHVLAESGKFVGIGQYRPQNGGTNGRFEVISSKWTEQ